MSIDCNQEYDHHATVLHLLGQFPRDIDEANAVCDHIKEILPIWLKSVSAGVVPEPFPMGD